MDRGDKRKFRLVLFRRIFSYLGTGLVISALLGGIYRDRIHFIWGLCAVGAILIGWGWYEYLKMTGSFAFLGRKKPKNDKVPYILRKDRAKKTHKPAFMQKAEDFEDDLTPYTTADTEVFSEKQVKTILIVSRIASGVLLFLISFFIPA